MQLLLRELLHRHGRSCSYLLRVQSTIERFQCAHLQLPRAVVFQHHRRSGSRLPRVQPRIEQFQREHVLLPPREVLLRSALVFV